MTLLVCPSCHGRQDVGHVRDCAVVNRQACDLIHRGIAPAPVALVPWTWPATEYPYADVG